LKERYPGRYEHILEDPFRWEAYTDIEDKGFFEDVPTVPWEDSGALKLSLLTCFLVDGRS